MGSRFLGSEFRLWIVLEIQREGTVIVLQLSLFFSD